MVLHNMDMVGNQLEETYIRRALVQGEVEYSLIAEVSEIKWQRERGVLIIDCPGLGLARTLIRRYGDRLTKNVGKITKTYENFDKMSDLAQQVTNTNKIQIRSDGKDVGPLFPSDLMFQESKPMLSNNTHSGTCIVPQKDKALEEEVAQTVRPRVLILQPKRNGMGRATKLYSNDGTTVISGCDRASWHGSDPLAGWYEPDGTTVMGEYLSDFIEPLWDTFLRSPSDTLGTPDNPYSYCARLISNQHGQPAGALMRYFIVGRIREYQNKMVRDITHIANPEPVFVEL